MAYDIQQGNTALPLRFLLVLSSNHIAGAVGKTPVVTIAKTNGTFAAPAGSIAELGNGWYAVQPHPSDASVLGPLTLHATAPGCDPADEEFVVVNYNPSITASQGTPSTTVISVRELITMVLRRMRVISVGEDITADMAADSLLILNQLIDTLAIQALTIYTTATTTFPLTSAKGTPTNPYTIGPGGDLNIARPIYLSQLRYQDVAPPVPQEYPLWMLTQQAYASIPQKTLTSTRPTMAYYEPTFPLGSLYLWMIPSQANLRGVLDALAQIPKFGALTDLVALPPGYERMLRDQLYVELWPDYRADAIDPSMVGRARESLALIKAANVRLTDMRLDPAILPARRAYDITTG